MNTSTIGASAHEYGRLEFTQTVDAATTEAARLSDEVQRAAVLRILERCRGTVDTLILAGDSDGMTFGLRSVLARYGSNGEPAEAALETPVSDRVLAEFDLLADEAVTLLQANLTPQAFTVAMHMALVKMQARLVTRYAQLGGTTRGVIEGNPMNMMAKAIEEALRNTENLSAES